MPGDKRAGSQTGRDALAGLGRPSRIDRSWFSSSISGRFRPSWSSRRSACRHGLATLPITSNGTLETGLRFAIAADPTTCHRAPCRLDKYERITKLAICDSFAQPSGCASSGGLRACSTQLCPFIRLYRREIWLAGEHDDGSIAKEQGGGEARPGKCSATKSRIAEKLSGGPCKLGKRACLGGAGSST